MKQVLCRNYLNVVLLNFPNITGLVDLFLLKNDDYTNTDNRLCGLMMYNKMFTSYTKKSKVPHSVKSLTRFDGSITHETYYLMTEEVRFG